MSDSEIKIIELPENLTVRDFAQSLDTSPIEIIKILMANGVMASINQYIDFDTAAIVAAEMGIEVQLANPEDADEEETGEIPYWRQVLLEENPKDLKPRAPVITILGHVDHGKTTLLDAIRHTEVASGEAGGITQHIGAYQIVHQKKEITFLDTPGHAAFSAMRARGAQGADIVVLVVAANDGVMPQTREAIAHAKAAQVPIIVALNKIDREDANIEFVKGQLAETGLIPDEWDGDTIIVPVSAKEKMGLDDLLEAIILVADSTEIKANPNGKTIGTIIEAKRDKAKGVLTTMLIQNGSLKSGSYVVAGTACGRARAMFDYRGKQIKKAGPSTPVQIMGLNDVPHAGDIFEVFFKEKEGRQAAERNKEKEKNKLHNAPKATLEELFANFQSGEVKELRLIVKSDVDGSLEPIKSSLKDIDSGDIKVNVLHASAGNISESDIMLASASNAIVLGFNVSADNAAKRLAETEKISIRLYNIIYRLIEDVEKALKGMLEPKFIEIALGKAEVLQVFKISKIGNIAGSRVLKGEIHRNANVRVLRDGEVVHEGEISSLRHEKEVVKEVRTGFECGISVKNFKDFESGDIVECFRLEKETF